MSASRARDDRSRLGCLTLSSPRGVGVETGNRKGTEKELTCDWLPGSSSAYVLQWLPDRCGSVALVIETLPIGGGLLTCYTAAEITDSASIVCLVTAGHWECVPGDVLAIDLDPAASSDTPVTYNIRTK